MRTLGIFHAIRWGILFSILAFGFVGVTSAQVDFGKAEVGMLQVTVYFGTDGDASLAGEKAREISAGIAKRLSSTKQLHFKNYRVLGADQQAIFRSYENWAQPLKPSDEILIRFETRSLQAGKVDSLDLDLWLGRKKVLKTDVKLQEERPLFILGPEWRGGRLIISVALAPGVAPAP